MVAELIFKTFNNLLDKYLRGHRHLRSETMSNNTDTEFQPCVVLIGLACTTEKKKSPTNMLNLLHPTYDCYI